MFSKAQCEYVVWNYMGYHFKIGKSVKFVFAIASIVKFNDKYNFIGITYNICMQISIGKKLSCVSEFTNSMCIQFWNNQ